MPAGWSFSAIGAYVGFVVPVAGTTADPIALCDAMGAKEYKKKKYIFKIKNSGKYA